MTCTLVMYDNAATLTGIEAVKVVTDKLTVFDGNSLKSFVTNISNFDETTTSFSLTLTQYVYTQLKQLGFDVNLIDLRSKRFKLPLKPSNRFLELREEQITAYNAIVSNNLDGVPFYNGIIGAAPNFGKSAIIFELLSSDKKVLIIVPDKKIINQHTHTLVSLGVPKDNIGHIFRQVKMTNIVFTLPTVFNNRIEDGSLQNFRNYFDIIVYDEAHKVLSNTLLHSIKYFNSFSTIGFTGTHSDANYFRQLSLKAVCGDILYDASFEDVYNLGYSAKVMCKLHNFNNRTKYANATKSSQSSFEAEHTYTDKFFKLLLNIIEKAEGKVLINHFSVKFGNALEEYVTNNSNFGLIRVDGKSKKNTERLLDFSTSTAKVLIGSKSIEAGINMPYLTDIVICEAFVNMTSLKQVIGRGTRKNDVKEVVIIHDFIFTSEVMSKNSYLRKAAYEKENFIII